MRRTAFLAGLVVACLGCEEATDSHPPAPSPPRQASPGSQGASAGTGPAAVAVPPQVAGQRPSSDADEPAAPPSAGAPSDTAALTRNFYFILDGSGSMNEHPATRCSADAQSRFSSKIDAARWAIGEFLQQVPPDDRLGLFVFDRGGQREVVPLGTANREQFLAAVRSVNANGGTPLAEGIIAGVDKLVAQRDRQLGYGDFRLVVVTDGEATGRRLEDGTTYALKKRIPIYTIGFCVGGTHALFRSSVAYRAANSPAELRRGLEETLGELETFDMKSFGGQ